MSKTQEARVRTHAGLLVGGSGATYYYRVAPSRRPRR